MNILLENGYLTEMVCGSNFSYIVSDNSSFLSTEYKVLQNQANSCFVKCMKMLYNGKIQLYYVTHSLKPFSTMIPTLDADGFLTIVSNLISDIVDVKQNGFLSCQNIDISFDRIYVDPATYKVSLVYVPLSRRLYSDVVTFENEIRTSLIKLISGVSTICSPKTMNLSQDLANGTLSMEALRSRLSGNVSGRGRMPESDYPSGVSGRGRMSKSEYPSGKNGVLRIVAMNAPTRVELKVNKNEYIIGKNASAVDGVISFNKMISRVHCKINKQGNQYTITDLQSANGTYVNKVKLYPHQPHLIKHGDIIRLANSDFQISMM